jgi:hypothetical protein
VNAFNCVSLFDFLNIYYALLIETNITKKMNKTTYIIDIHSIIVVFVLK